MIFKRSTRSIVTGKRPRAPQNNPEQEPNPTPSPAPEGQETSNKPQFHTEVKKFMNKLNLPRWSWWAIGGAALVCLLVIILLIAAPKHSEPASTKPTLPQIGADQTVVSVQADAALTALVEAGDIVQLYTTDGDVIEELQYVQVYQPSEEGCLLLLVDSKQAAAFVSNEISTRVVLVAHDDADRAGELLDLQKRINDPQITLELQSAITVSIGVTTDLEYKVEIDPPEAKLPSIQWSSSDSSIVTVRDGKIMGLKVGTATVTAKCGDQKATCTVTAEITLEEIQLDKYSVVMAVGENLPLEARPEPQDTTNFDLTWSTSDPSVATVDENGTVTAIAPGTVVVTATSGSVTAECKIRVGYHAEVVQHDPQSITIPMGDEYILKPIVYPNADLIDEVTYSSSSSIIATVLADGTIFAMNPGTATITIHCGGKTFQVTVTVTAP